MPDLLSLHFYSPSPPVKALPLESTANTLNRDLDLVRSPYQYTPTPEKDRLIRVLRKMPVGQTAADATLRADLERAIAQKLGSAPASLKSAFSKHNPVSVVKSGLPKKMPSALPSMSFFAPTPPASHPPSKAPS